VVLVGWPAWGWLARGLAGSGLALWACARSRVQGVARRGGKQPGRSHARHAPMHPPPPSCATTHGPVQAHLSSGHLLRLAPALPWVASQLSSTDDVNRLLWAMASLGLHNAHAFRAAGDALLRLSRTPRQQQGQQQREEGRGGAAGGAGEPAGLAVGECARAAWAFAKARQAHDELLQAVVQVCRARD
jgi:hypothetical protein